MRVTLNRSPHSMQSIYTLIQQLAAAANRGEDNSALLARVEELRTKLQAVQSIVEEKVAVTTGTDILLNNIGKSTAALPKPSLQYAPPKPPAVIVVEEETAPVVLSVEEVSVVEEPLMEHQPEPVIELVEHIAAVAPPPLEAAPIVVNVASTIPDTTPVTHTYESIADPMVKAALRRMEELHAAFLPPAEEVHELPLTEEMMEEAEAIEMAKLPPMPESFEQMPTPKEVAEQDEKNQQRDLNDKLAQRTKVLNELFEQPAPVLAEKIAPGKITDLRKAISISEKYQFIESLFRGDEQMFERSVKTLNGFSIYQEAQYWMQRELLLKLGWSESDVLVQQFVSLVQRRFA